ncbi:hypothetical protein [Chitinophaga ginsengisegetis]|uniref:hypothetical protein n=1 Tax=Chitinophaga ginsengisegetis TaxID=393003 RepID=UPI000DB94C75|nr:hypothetical protein [Chitinophaga ginsengisegetis]MDR6565456.1 hypothetical protein [Chitinophaga ginsengisegetis]MDR6645184.1 hypothetical protein [Chitinophaga ginsengisegetis]MDR6652224.1 hypothetical protein [Chitinophaga ginsengisegetis]
MVKAWREYNQQLAESHYLVLHNGLSLQQTGLRRKSFFRDNNLEEAEGAQQHNLHSPCIALSGLRGKLIGQDPAFRKSIKTAVYFLSSVRETYADLEEALELTGGVMMDFLSRYQEDFLTSGTCGPFKDFDIGKAVWDQVGPLLNNFHGWKVELEFVVSASDLTFNPQKWR